MSKLTLLAAALMLSASATMAADTADYTKWVNPFVGTTNFGTTNPGAVVPNGMM